MKCDNWLFTSSLKGKLLLKEQFRYYSTNTYPQLHHRRDDAYGHDLFDIKANIPP